MTAAATEISVIIVSYEVRELLLRCLDTVLPELEGLGEVIVLDNASSDGSAAAVAERFPQVRLVESSVNVGFAAGCNTAADLAKGRYLLLLNPDTEVHPGAVEALLDLARRRPGAQLWGGRTVDPQGDLDPRSCWGLPTLWSRTCFALGLDSAFRGSLRFDPESLGSWQRDDEREVGMITGCLLMVERRFWSQLGGFDLRFFMYGEDTDLNLRARRAGARPMITPAATVTHVVGASSHRTEKMVMLLRGKATLARLHRGPLGRTYELGCLGCGVGLRALGATVAGRGGRHAGWPSVWRQRRDWWAGYPPTATSGASVRVPDREVITAKVERGVEDR